MLESYGLAIEDANEAIKLDPAYIKAYYRRGSANYALGKTKAALRDFKAVVKLVPKDADAQKKMKACEKAVREDAFNKAIEVENPLAGTGIKVDVDNIIVEPGYDGPKLEQPEPGLSVTVTWDFVVEMIARFQAQKLVHRKYVLQILLAARDMFSSLPSLIRVSLPVQETPKSETDDVAKEATGKPTYGHFTVCGDTHGQFYDLCNIFELGGYPSEWNPYLFNGDFVDRGSFSFETVFTLIAMKMACPSAVHMLRGNHETKNMNKIYGFEGEVKHKYDDTVVQVFTDLFNWLPIAAVLHDSVFIVHGGLSTNTEGSAAVGAITLKAIENIPRGREPPEAGLMADLLWSDPQPANGRAPSKRGVGFSFGPNYTKQFLEANNLSLVVRSHEVKDEGYVLEHDDKCITVFSAPNYCDQMGNKGAFIRFNEDMQPHFTKFNAVPHPNVPPMRYAGNMFGL
jgi:serine/threonine-protein phosphatase 5